MYRSLKYLSKLVFVVELFSVFALPLGIPHPQEKSSLPWTEIPRRFPRDEHPGPGPTPNLPTYAKLLRAFLVDIESNATNGNIDVSNNPLLHPSEWVALGDSYAAGPGAGDTVDQRCLRGSAAYPLQLQGDEFMPGPAEGQLPRFTFKACTGDVTVNLTDSTNPNYQLDTVGDRTTFVTLSIGGNDVLFAKILMRCVYGTWGFIGPSCDDVLDAARSNLYGVPFWNNYNELMNQILARLNWQGQLERGRNVVTAIFQTGYSQFFESDTTQCNGASFWPLIGPAGPKVSQDTRIKLNRLTHEVNCAPVLDRLYQCYQYAAPRYVVSLYSGDYFR